MNSFYNHFGCNRGDVTVDYNPGGVLHTPFVVIHADAEMNAPQIKRLRDLLTEALKRMREE